MQAISERELIIYQLMTRLESVMGVEPTYRALAEILEMSQTGVMKAYQRAAKKMEAVDKPKAKKD